MEQTIQEFLVGLFGGDVSFFSSLWDIIQGFILVGGGVVAMIYRHRDTVSRAVAKVKSSEVDKLSGELNVMKVGVHNEVAEIKEVVTYMADMMVTMSLASPVLLDKAKQKIAGYAEQIKKIKGVELEAATQEIIKAVVGAPVATTLKQEETKIEIKAQEIKEEIKKAEETVKDLINRIPL